MSETNGVKTHMNDLLPKPYLRPTDLHGREVSITIKSWGTQEFYDQETRGQVEKGVIYFEKTEKYLIVNKTQLDQISKAVGSEYLEDWVGKKITLFATQVQAFGKMEDAIRIKKYVAPTAPAAGNGNGAQPAKASDLLPKDEPAEDTQQEGEGGDPGPVEGETSTLTEQEFYNLAYGKFGADRELVESCLKDAGGDFEKALEIVKKNVPVEG